MGIFIFSVLVPALFFTALLSGVFGMVGGMILMGVLLALFSVSDAMVLHGIAQTSSNGSRVVLHFKNIQWRIIFFYLLGVAPMMLLFGIVAFVIDKAWALVGLGSFALLTIASPKRVAFDSAKPTHAALCGASNTAAHFTIGVTGPLLDIFYLRSTLNRHQIIATKAATQTLGHITKIIYFTLIVRSGYTIEFDLWVYAMIVALAFAGAFLGRAILNRFSEVHFRTGMNILLGFSGLVYLIWGGYLLSPWVE